MFKSCYTVGLGKSPPSYHTIPDFDGLECCFQWSWVDSLLGRPMFSSRGKVFVIALPAAGVKRKGNLSTTFWAPSRQPCILCSEINSQLSQDDPWSVCASLTANCANRTEDDRSMSWASGRFLILCNFRWTSLDTRGFKVFSELFDCHGLPNICVAPGLVASDSDAVELSLFLG
jgi:hypothetical protein